MQIHYYYRPTEISNSFSFAKIIGIGIKTSLALFIYFIYLIFHYKLGYLQFIELVVNVQLYMDDAKRMWL